MFLSWRSLNFDIVKCIILFPYNFYVFFMFKQSFLNSRLKICSYIFFFKVYIFIFTFLIYLEFVFVNGVRWTFNVFPQMEMQLFQYYYERDQDFPLDCLVPLIHMCLHLFGYYLFQAIDSFCLYFWNYYTLIIVILQKFLIFF